MAFAFSFISYGIEFCFITERNGIWIFEPHEDGNWFYYNHHIYKIRDPVDAGIHFNEKTFKFEIDEKKLRWFLEMARIGKNWKFGKLGWMWTISDKLEEEGKAWGFGGVRFKLYKRDIEGLIKVVKEWLTGRGGKPIFDLEGEIDIPVEERYRKALGQGEHVKAVAKHDVDGDGKEEVVICTAVDKDWRSPGYVYIWEGGRFLLKYRLGSMPRLTDNAIKPAIIKFYNLNHIDWDEVIVFWLHVWYDEKYESFLVRLSFTIFSFDDLEKLCDPWGKLKRAKEEYKKSGGE